MPQNIDYRIAPIAEEHIEGFHAAVDSVKKNAVRVDGRYEALFCMAVLFDRPGRAA